MSTTWPSFTPTYHHDVYPAISPTQEHLNCKSQNVLITGAGSGIGQAVAMAFAQAHARGIVLVGRTESTLRETEQLVRKLNNDTKTLITTADITKAESVESAFAKAREAFGSIDTLVNCAGGSLAFGSVAEINLTDFWKTFELNVLGPTTVIQAFIKSSQADADPKPRTVINLPSGAAHIPYAETAVAYAASKLANAKVIEYVHYEHRDWRVFNLQPGVVATALAKQTGRKGEDTPELCASMAVWLARDPRAVELNGRFLWANWDVNELLEMKDRIHDQDLLKLGLKGWADGYTVDSLLERAAKAHGNAHED